MKKNNNTVNKAPAPRKRRKPVKEVEYSYAARHRSKKDLDMRREDAPFQLIKGKKRKSNKVRTAITLIIIVLVIGSLVYLNSLAPGGLIEFSENYYAGLGSGQGFPVKIPDEKVESIYTVGSDMIVLTDAALLEYNASAYQIFNRQHGMGSPAVDTISSRTLIYDRGGKNLKIENKYTTVFETTMDSAILTAAIGKDGSIVVVTRSEIHVYDGNTFQKVYWRQLASGEITSVDISENGRNIVYSIVEAKQGRFVSSVYICNIKKEDPIAQQIFEDAFVLTVDYKSFDKVAVLTDTMFSTIDSDGQNRIDQSFEGKSLKTADRTKEEHTAFLLSDQSGDTSNRLMMISADGQVLADFEWQEDLRDIAADYDSIYGICGKKLVRVDLSGNLQKEWEVGTDASALVLQNDKAVILKNSEISILEAES